MNCDYPNPWIYRNSILTSEDIVDYVGMVYLLVHVESGKKYIGKKIFFSKRKLPPLKGKKRKRTKIVESGWKTYYSSSEEINQYVKEHGEESFKRYVLHLCKSKGEMSYLELQEQMEREVLLKPNEYYNGIVQVRIHRNHVTNLQEREKDYERKEC